MAGRTPAQLDAEIREHIATGATRRGEIVIKLVSTRSGAVSYLRDDGTPTNYRGEAGRYTTAAAQAMIDEAKRHMPRWTFTTEPK